jgi:hypothetical protein
METCYCAFCKCERRVHTKKHVCWTDVLSCIAMAALLTLVIWHKAEPRGILFISIFLGISEFFIQMRWRLALSCRYCGFDPILYKQSHQLAAEKVKKHLDRRRADPSFLLSSKPFSTMPIRKSSPPSVSTQV